MELHVPVGLYAWGININVIKKRLGFTYIRSAYDITLLLLLLKQIKKLDKC